MPPATTSLTSVANEESVAQAQAFQAQLKEAQLLLAAVVEQGREARSQFEAVREERRQAAGEIEALRQHARSAQEQLLRDANETRETQQLLRQEAQGCAEQVAAAGRQIDQARGRILGVLEEEVGRIRQQLREAAGSFAELPRQVDEASRRLAGSAAQIRACEEAAAVAAGQRAAVEQDNQEAVLRRNALAGEVAEAERQLASLRRELEAGERRLEGVRRRQEELENDRDDHDAEEGDEAAAGGRNRFGVTIEPGVLVAEVVPGTPAALAGLRRGDVITAVNGEVVPTGADLRELIEAEPVGEDLALRVTRDGVVTEVKARLDEGPVEPSPEGRNRLGVTVDPGVLVAEVVPGTPAALAGLSRGDVIASVNGEVVLTGPDLRKAVEESKDHANVTLLILRAGVGREVVARLDE